MIRYSLMMLVGVSLAMTAGCGRSVTRMDKLERVQSAVLTDAHALIPGKNGQSSASLVITDPDQLIALQQFLESNQGKWQPLQGTPRPTRYQLELVGGGGPMYTLWVEPGYIAMASGKRLQEARLSNAEMEQLLGCLGLPAGALQVSDPQEMMEPNYGVADGPQPPRGNVGPNSGGARTVEYNVPAADAAKMADTPSDAPAP